MDTRGAALVAAARLFACRRPARASGEASPVTFKLLEIGDHEVKARAAGLLARFNGAPAPAAPPHERAGRPRGRAGTAAAAARRIVASIERDNVVRALAGVLQARTRASDPRISETKGLRARPRAIAGAEARPRCHRGAERR